MDRPQRSVPIIAGGVVALVIATVATMLLAGPGNAARFPAGSPEDALQRYLIAVQAGDADQAFNLLSDNARQVMSEDDFKLMLLNEQRSPARIEIRGVTHDTQGATVSLLVARWGGGPGVAFATYTSSVHLVREAGGWSVDQPLLFL